MNLGVLTQTEILILSEDQIWHLLLILVPFVLDQARDDNGDDQEYSTKTSKIVLKDIESIRICLHGELVWITGPNALVAIFVIIASKWVIILPLENISGLVPQPRPHDQVITSPVLVLAWWHVKEGVVFLEVLHARVNGISGILGAGVLEHCEVARTAIVVTEVTEGSPIDQEIVEIETVIACVLAAALLGDLEAQVHFRVLSHLSAFSVEFNVFAVEVGGLQG